MKKINRLFFKMLLYKYPNNLKVLSRILNKLLHLMVLDQSLDRAMVFGAGDNEKYRICI